MNGSYYQNPTFPTSNYPTPPGNISISDQDNSIPMMEQSYIENILRMNKDKLVKMYVSYPDSSAWQNKVYEGTIEAAGKDHVIIKDPSTDIRYLIRLIYLDYVEFMGVVNYNYPYQQAY